MLYGFDMDAEGKVSLPSILKRIECGDIDPRELFIGGEVAEMLDEETKKRLPDAEIHPGVKVTAAKLCGRIKADLGIS